MKISVPFTTLSKLKSEDNLDLYVINNSMNLKGKSPSQIFIDITDGVNHAPITVPLTWVPINVGSQAPKEMLLKSPNFLNAVNKKFIIPVSTEEAEKFFEKDREARIELDRAISTLTNGSQVDLAKVEGFSNSEVEGEIEGDVHTSIIEACLREDITESEQYAIVVNAEKIGNLNKDTCDFLIENSAFDKVKKLATNQLTRLK